MATWRKMLEEDFKTYEDGGYNGLASIEFCNLNDESLDEEFDEDVTPEFMALPLLVYTKERIYFSGVKSNSVHLFSFPREAPKYTSDLTGDVQAYCLVE